MLANINEMKYFLSSENRMRTIYSSELYKAFRKNLVRHLKKVKVYNNQNDYMNLNTILEWLLDLIILQLKMQGVTINSIVTVV